MIASVSLDAVSSRTITGPVRSAAASTEDPATVATAVAVAAPKAASPVYFSPILHLDREAERVVIQFRDADSGETVQQYPTKKQLEVYRTAQSESQQPVAEKRDAAAARKDTSATAEKKERP